MLIIISFYIIELMFSDQLLTIRAYTCKISAERDQFDKCKVIWVLDYQNPCECTKVAIGGFTTPTPNRQYTPVHAERPMVSENIDAFRMHYGTECGEESKCHSLLPKKITNA